MLGSCLCGRGKGQGQVRKFHLYKLDRTYWLHFITLRLLNANDDVFECLLLNFMKSVKEEIPYYCELHALSYHPYKK